MTGDFKILQPGNTPESRAAREQGRGAPSRRDSDAAAVNGPEAAAEVRDPVCGMTFAPEDAAATAEYQGKTYYFCATSCLERFNANPAAFIDGSVAQPALELRHRDPV